jgi:hypothetical protein
MEDLLMDHGDLLADWSAELSRETSPDGAGRDTHGSLQSAMEKIV